MARIKTSNSGNEKHSLILNLSKLEMQVLERLAAKRGLTKSGLLRQALRLYESIDDRTSRGEKLYLEDPKKKAKSELMLI